MPRSCLFGCANNGVALHSFPNPYRYPERFRTWVRLVGGGVRKISNYKYYQHKVICDKHFRAGDHNPNHRLNASAVPSRHLRGIAFQPSYSSDNGRAFKPMLVKMEDGTSAIVYEGPIPGHAHPDPVSILRQILHNHTEENRQLSNKVERMRAKVNSVRREINMTKKLLDKIEKLKNN